TDVDDASSTAQASAATPKNELKYLFLNTIYPSLVCGVRRGKFPRKSWVCWRCAGDPYCPFQNEDGSAVKTETVQTAAAISANGWQSLRRCARPLRPAISAA